MTSITFETVGSLVGWEIYQVLSMRHEYLFFCELDIYTLFMTVFGLFPFFSKIIIYAIWFH